MTIEYNLNKYYLKILRSHKFLCESSFGVIVAKMIIPNATATMTMITAPGAAPGTAPGTPVAATRRRWQRRETKINLN